MTFFPGIFFPEWFICREPFSRGGGGFGEGFFCGISMEVAAKLIGLWYCTGSWRPLSTPKQLVDSVWQVCEEGQQHSLLFQVT